MSELIIIGFDNPVTARAAYDEVLALQSDFIADLKGVAVVTVDAEGKTHVETPQKIVGIGAASAERVGKAAEPRKQHHKAVFERNRRTHSSS